MGGGGETPEVHTVEDASETMAVTNQPNFGCVVTTATSQEVKYALPAVLLAPNQQSPVSSWYGVMVWHVVGGDLRPQSTHQHSLTANQGSIPWGTGGKLLPKFSSFPPQTLLLIAAFNRFGMKCIKNITQHLETFLGNIPPDPLHNIYCCSKSIYLEGTSKDFPSP